MPSLVKNPNDIRLAMLGMVEGNGHPFSWSAIINGFDRDEMESCPYELIRDYLFRQPLETIGVPGARVTHVWTDDPADAREVSRCARVPHIVSDPCDVIGHVDAVIIPTDKGHEHVERCRPFVEAGLPIFVDKPMVDNEPDLRTFCGWVGEGSPIMSSSALRYAKEYLPFHESTADVGDLHYLSATMVKNWEKYGIHAMEGVYPILGPGFKSIRHNGTDEHNIMYVTHESETSVVLAVIAGLYQSWGVMTLAGSQGHRETVFKDLYYAFKAQLVDFIAYLRSGERPFPFDETVELMRLVIGGILSKEQGGATIPLASIAPDLTW